MLVFQPSTLVKRSWKPKWVFDEGTRLNGHLDGGWLMDTAT